MLIQIKAISGYWKISAITASPSHYKLNAIAAFRCGKNFIILEGKKSRSNTV